MIVEKSSYRSPWYLPGADLQTIAPQLRTIEGVAYRRQRLELADGDFVDVDWSQVGSERLVLIAHGMEGNSRRPYMLGMAQTFNRAGWDVLAWNMRACSGESNRLPSFYHAGMTSDLEAVVQCALETGLYAQIVLVGFSLGGNLILKYLGERGRNAPRELRSAVTFSVPCDLVASAAQIHRLRNRFYLLRFMRHLRAKIRAKARAMPGLIDAEGLEELTDLHDFDGRFTAPLHGYADAEEYWRLNSCLAFLAHITVPSLIVNARNDSFLVGACYPYEQALDSRYVHLEVPAVGGHVGFPLGGGRCWMEERALEFAERPEPQDVSVLAPMAMLK